MLADAPPADFWLAVTVMRPIPLGALINARTEADRSNRPRPARYVVEADAILRVAIGYGATEQTFPPQTRQLSRTQWTGLWHTLRDSGLADPDHPSRTARLPTLDEIGASTEGRGGYFVSFCIAGERRAVFIDEAAPEADHARALVEHLDALAWIVPKPAPTEPAP